jgi:type II secretory pathway component PulC
MSLRFTNAQIALLALCGVLTIAFLYELFAPLRPYTPPQVDNTHAAYTVQMPTPYTPPDFATYSNVDARSVFNPLRTPIETESEGLASSASAGDSLPPDLSLVGVILDGTTKMALLKSASELQVVSVPQGTVYEGWEVTTVEPDRVVFAAHGNQQELKLSDNKKATPAAKSDDDDSDDQDDKNQNKPQVQNRNKDADQPQAKDDSDQ